jgi:predicted transposase/invertase (TIGR01784 family)
MSKNKKIDKSILQSHDKFIKSILTNKSDAIDFFKNYLSEDILKNLDLRTLKHEKESFISEKLKSDFSDLLFSVKNKKNKKVLIYILFEHKSKPDRWVSFQLLKYMLSIWERELKNNPKLKKLPAILPFVFYHGKQKWHINKYFKNIVEQSLPEEYIPNFKYYLNDLSKYTEDTIKGKSKLKLSLLTMKYIFEKDVAHILVENKNKDISEYLGTKQGSELFKKILIYILSNQDLELEEVKEIIKKSDIKNKEEVMVTTAERLIYQGYEQGEQEGIQKAKLEDCKKMFELGFDIDLIHKITGLTKKEIKNVIKK